MHMGDGIGKVRAVLVVTAGQIETSPATRYLFFLPTHLMIRKEMEASPLVHFSSIALNLSFSCNFSRKFAESSQVFEKYYFNLNYMGFLGALRVTEQTFSFMITEHHNACNYHLLTLAQILNSSPL